MQLAQPQLPSLNHLLLHVKEAVDVYQDFSPQIIADLEHIVTILKNKVSIDCIYDTKQKTFFHKGEALKLTKKEVLFLDILIKNSFRIVTYTELQNYVWKDIVMTDNAIRSLVRHLRRKLPVCIIENHSGIGYKFAKNECLNII